MKAVDEYPPDLSLFLQPNEADIEALGFSALYSPLEQSPLLASADLKSPFYPSSLYMPEAAPAADMTTHLPSPAQEQMYPLGNTEYESLPNEAVRTVTLEQLNDLAQSPSPEMDYPRTRRDRRSSDTERRHACPSCGRSFVRRFNMITHMKTHDKTRYLSPCPITLTIVGLVLSYAPCVQRVSIDTRTSIGTSESIAGRLAKFRTGSCTNATFVLVNSGMKIRGIFTSSLELVE